MFGTCALIGFFLLAMGILTLFAPDTQTAPPPSEPAPTPADVPSSRYLAIERTPSPDELKRYPLFSLTRPPIQPPKKKPKQSRSKKA